MPNRNYIKGYRFERRVKKHLEKQGWTVFRQGKSAFPDLICLRMNTILEAVMPNLKDQITDVMLVECKVNEKDLSKEEVEALRTLREDTNASTFLAYREKRKIKLKEM
jgi:Holliday junction resolvase